MAKWSEAVTEVKLKQYCIVSVYGLDLVSGEWYAVLRRQSSDPSTPVLVSFMKFLLIIFEDICLKTCVLREI